MSYELCVLCCTMAVTYSIVLGHRHRATEALDASGLL
jgi:hypothetical protein